MKILMKTMAAGANGNLFPGKKYEVDDVFGKDLVDGRYAEELDGAGVPVPRAYDILPEAVEIIESEVKEKETTEEPVVFSSIEKANENVKLREPRPKKD